ncbi:serine hydrolase domain-containing protein [Agaribacter flavus]|uniref:Serine hydrolase domain-containing protein n=1 Tax=Agaribacter flavus TaxID=1902781 RepID=A0ABV7FQ54_9ALTE
MRLTKKLYWINLFIFSLLLAQTKAIASAEVDGVWRGKLEFEDGKGLAIGLNVSDNGKHLNIDSVFQNMRAHVPTSFEVSDTQIKFEDTPIKAKFSGNISGDKLEGVFSQGKDRPLLLNKLSKADLEWMQYEGKYAGELKINANTTLPLVLHVAVVKDGFVAALDSPAQNSYGIPVSSVSVDAKLLTFTSTLLSASFTGNFKGNSYQGTFTQGIALPFSLQKVTAETAKNMFKLPEFGEKGGSVAIVTANDIQSRYLGTHTKDTLYEIGSVTKTFSAYLLAKQVESGKLSLDTKLEVFFPASPAISLQSLATHTSGLARNPAILASVAHPTNPFVNFTVEHLKEDLASISLSGNDYKYSNYGMACLAEALALHNKTSYSELVQKEIFQAMDMSASYVAVSKADMHESLAQGHSATGQKVEAWQFGAMSGAGAIVANLDDMAKYVRQMMAISASSSSLAKTLFAKYLTFSACCGQALGWLIEEDPQGKPFAWHNGMTGGFSSFVGFYLDGSKGVVLLNNQASTVDKEGRELLFQAS